MLKTFSKVSAGVSIAALLSSAAFAEMVYNRGNSDRSGIARSAQNLDGLRGAYPARPL